MKSRRRQEYSCQTVMSLTVAFADNSQAQAQKLTQAKLLVIQDYERGMGDSESACESMGDNLQQRRYPRFRVSFI